MSKVTCIIFARHPYRKDDAQQQRVIFMHVTIDRFLHSDGREQHVVLEGKHQQDISQEHKGQGS